MQRKFIRFFGTLVSMTGMLIPGGARATDTPTTTPTTPTETPTACVMAGQPSSTFPSGCVKVSGEQLSQSGNYYYQQYNCGSGATTYVGSGANHALIGKYQNPCVMTPSTTPGAEYIGINEFCRLGATDPTTTGRCENETIYCYSPEPFIQAGCCLTSGSGTCVPTNDCQYDVVGASGGVSATIFEFVGCASGYYKVGALGIQNQSSLDELSSLYQGCCAACSGITVDANGNINTVGSVVGGGNSADGFYWVADQNSYGIDSCTAYPSGGELTGSGRDNSGTFQFSVSTACPYNK